MSAYPELTAADRAAGLRNIVNSDSVLFGENGEWPEAREEILESAKLLDRHSAMVEFLEQLSRMKTEEEYGDDCPPSEDWICTLSDMIEGARKVLK